MFKTLFFSSLINTGAYGLQYDPTLLKNKDADFGNPNMYHELDKQKMEHIYDEIKQNNVELEYDHLDYTRAQSDRKPHYQRMANSLGSSDRDSSSGPSRSSTSENPPDLEKGES